MPLSNSFPRKVIIEPGATATKFDHVFFSDTPTNGETDTTCEDCYVGGLQAENTPWPWNYSTTKMISDGIRVEANPKGFFCRASGAFRQWQAPSAIHRSRTGYRGIRFSSVNGQTNRGSAPQAPAIVELSDTNPSFCHNGHCLTASITDGVFKGSSSSRIITFAGEILVIPANSSTSGTAYLQTSDSIATGTKIVYRCVAAGNLPTGALTIAAGDCGSTQDSGLRIK